MDKVTRQRILNLARQGVPAVDIAAAVSYSYGTIARITRLAGVKCHRKGSFVYALELARATTTAAGCIEYNPLVERPTPYVFVNGRTVSLNRAAWENKYGKLTDSTRVYNCCGNPRCMNVEHMSLGTKAKWPR
jgi:hypothetical protein